MTWQECADFFIEINSSDYCFFIGAGLSRDSKLPTWEELVDPYASKMGINTSDIPLTTIMQYALGNSKAEYSKFKQQFKMQIMKAKPASVHKMIATLMPHRIWTTNYDSLLEDSYEYVYNEKSLNPQIVCDDNDLQTVDYFSPQIIKIHGSLTTKRESEIVITDSEYEEFQYKKKHIFSLLQNDMKMKSFIYLGFSFDDPNIRRICSSVWMSQNTGKPSFIFIVPPDRQLKKKNILYNLWKDDLERYGVNVVELNTYDEIKSFLEVLLNQYCEKKIVILGKYKSDKYKCICENIGRSLAEKGYSIYSGGGPNVAKYIANGAWEIYDGSFENHKKVQFFYRVGGGSTNPKKGVVNYFGGDYQEIREKIIGNNNICLVIGEEDSNEDGIKSEIAIARKNGCKIIPVAVTGRTSLDTWKIEKKFISKLDDFHLFSKQFNDLNSSSIDNKQLVDSILYLVDYFSDKRFSGGFYE